MKAINEIRREEKKISRGDKTRAEILDVAVHIASAEGLEGLTIGRLADELDMSKSGLFAHFGSKEELQLAVIGRARDIFVREVVEPALETERGINRLLAMLDEWLSYMGRKVFRGGCFFMATAIEFDSRPGEVRSLIAALSRSWIEAFQTEIDYAKSIGQLDRSANSAQLAFELHALAQQANFAHQLFNDANAIERARSGIGNRIRACVTPVGLRALAECSKRKVAMRKVAKIRRSASAQAGRKGRTAKAGGKATTLKRKSA
ncbi:MAG TPA: TetR/AcrR family transcriptional regulator [Blastocatellia bacterium]|nr:TetR/AcrR family transcriptional regulator [Blastocatellia bacterium]